MALPISTLMTGGNQNVPGELIPSPFVTISTLTTESAMEPRDELTPSPAPMVNSLEAPPCLILE